MSLQTDSIDADGLARTHDGKLYVTLGNGSAAIPLTTVPNVTNVLAKSALPLVGLSSGSVSAVGAISGITALPGGLSTRLLLFPRERAGDGQCCRLVLLHLR